MQRRGAFGLLAVAMLVLGACGDDSGGAASDAGVEIDGAWARASVAGQDRGAIYFDLTVDTDDVLRSVSVPAAVAAAAQVHEVVAADMPGDTGSDDMPGDMGSDDMAGEMGSDDMDADMGDGEMAMTMREMADGVNLTAGETVSFEPGSYHVMLVDLADPLAVGEEFEITLEFDEAGTVTVTVPVSETAP